MKAHGSINFIAGDVRATIYGGRYKDFAEERRLAGVKMAAEIDHPFDIDIPTADFNVPSPNDMQLGVEQAIKTMAKGNDLYVGCMGGTGRTGLFMGCMAKIMIEYHGGEWDGFTDPVKLVRKAYKPHAIETQEQRDFVKTFNTKPALRLLELSQRIGSSGILNELAHAREEAQALRDSPTIQYIEKPVFREPARPYRNPLHRLLMFWRPD